MIASLSLPAKNRDRVGTLRLCRSEPEACGAGHDLISIPSLRADGYFIRAPHRAGPDDGHRAEHVTEVLASVGP